MFGGRVFCKEHKGIKNAPNIGGDGKFKSKCPFVLEIWQVREAVGRFSRTACNHAYPQKAIGFLKTREGGRGPKWSRGTGSEKGSKKRKVWHPFSLIALPFRTGCVVAGWEGRRPRSRTVWGGGLS